MNTNDQPATPSADEESATPRIYTKCPACRNDTLTINADKHLICTWISCPDPTLIDRISEVFPHKWEEAQRELASLQSARVEEIEEAKAVGAALFDQCESLRAALSERDREIERLEAQCNLLAESVQGENNAHMEALRAGQVADETITDLRSQLQAATARAEEAEKDRDKWTDEANARFISWEKSELDLQAIQKRADLLNTHNEHWVGVIRDQAAQLLALQAHVEAQSRALRNLIFTATKCWDDVKPIKDGPGLTVTHPMIEEAKAVMESQPDLPLIEEVREVLENVRGFEVIGERCRKRIDSILARLNPTKL